MPPSRWKIFRNTVTIVVAIILVKIGLQLLQFEFLSVTPLHTGMLAGSIFVLGFILTSTHADYKESEKMPVDIAMSLESMNQDGINFLKTNPKFPLSGYQDTIRNILTHFREDSQKQSYRSFEEAKKLAEYVFLMEQLDLPPNYIVKLKQELNIVVRAILRMHYLQKIQPLPSGMILVQSIVFLIIILLLFTKIGSLIDEIAVTAFIAFIYLYLLNLIRVMDRPFHPKGSTQDDVSFFLLEEQADRLRPTSKDPYHNF